jgi:hypothetical protein
LFSLVVALVGFFAYRWMTRGERKQGGREALTAVAGM